MKYKYIYDACYIILILTVCVGLFFIETGAELQVQLAAVSFLYSISILFFIVSSYRDTNFYPKPRYFFLFPVSGLSIIIISAKYLMKRRHFFLLIIAPFFFLISKFDNILYSILGLIFSYVQLVFVLVVGSILYHWLEARRQLSIYHLLPVYTLMLFFYPAYKFKNFWPLLGNPFGGFLFAPVLFANHAGYFFISLFVVVLMIIFWAALLNKLRVEWFI